jgi:hypothetical protein
MRPVVFHQVHSVMVRNSRRWLAPALEYGE